MAKFGVLFKYSPEGNRGFLKEGASKRVEAVKKALASAGGHLECLYWIGAGCDKKVYNKTSAPH